MPIIRTIRIVLLAIFITTISACKKDNVANPDDQIPNQNDSVFTDIEGNTYKLKKFGNRYWMIENFKATKDTNGQILQGVFTYDNNNSNVKDYGRLYTWPAAVQATPTGWHLPTQEDWEELINSFGGLNVAGGNLKETGTIHWNSPNTGATNSSGFTAVAGGFLGPDGLYYDLRKHGSNWGTANNAQEPFCIYMYNTTTNVISEVSPIDKTSGISFAVRFVKD